MSFLFCVFATVLVFDVIDSEKVKTATSDSVSDLNSKWSLNSTTIKSSDTKVAPRSRMYVNQEDKQLARQNYISSIVDKLVGRIAAQKENLLRSNQLKSEEESWRVIKGTALEAFSAEALEDLKQLALIDNKPEETFREIHERFREGVKRILPASQLSFRSNKKQDSKDSKKKE